MKTEITQTEHFPVATPLVSPVRYLMSKRDTFEKRIRNICMDLYNTDEPEKSAKVEELENALTTLRNVKATSNALHICRQFGIEVKCVEEEYPTESAYAIYFWNSPESAEATEYVLRFNKAYRASHQEIANAVMCYFE